MSTTTAITAIGSTQCGELITHKMFDAGAAMSATTEYANLVDEIAFFQRIVL